MTIGATTKITKTAGPSPLSANVRSSPQPRNRRDLEIAGKQAPLAAARAAAEEAGAKGETELGHGLLMVGGLPEAAGHSI